MAIVIDAIQIAYGMLIKINANDSIFENKSEVKG